MMFVQADAARLPFADDTFDLVFTSPPYIDARTYGINAQRTCQEWIEWMLNVVAEAVRVCKGLVLINCAGVTRKWCYQPGPEGLLYEWWKRGGRCWRPAFWHRVGIPGSGGKQWLRADIEYVLCFTKCEAAVPWADNTANGHAPRWQPGGELSYRTPSGERVNGRTKSELREKGVLLGGRSSRLVNGERQYRGYFPPEKANPGNLVSVKVGGGRLGNAVSHENEAPFPEKLAEWFIGSWCEPGGRVLDCFSGSGTTVAAARKLGRVGIGCDVRFSQCQLGARRCKDVQPELFN